MFTYTIYDADTDTYSYMTSDISPEVFAQRLAVGQSVTAVVQNGGDGGGVLATTLESAAAGWLRQVSGFLQNRVMPGPSPAAVLVKPAAPKNNNTLLLIGVAVGVIVAVKMGWLKL
jgi:hypothetical protein